jgi:hypothetical protein
MVFHTTIQIHLRFYIKYQSYFRGTDSNRGAHLYHDIKHIWVLAEIKEIKNDRQPPLFEIFLPELKQIINVNRKYLDLPYVRVDLPADGRCISWDEFESTEPDQARENLKLFQDNLKEMRKNEQIPLHMGQVARQKKLLQTLPSILLPTSQVPDHLVGTRDELRETLLQNQNDLFNPVEELILFIQKMGKLVYESLSSSTAFPICMKQLRVNSRLVATIFIPWLQLGGFEQDQDAGTWYTTDMVVLDRTITESTLYSDLKTPARRVFFASDAAEKEMLARMDGVPEAFRIDASNTSGAAQFRESMQLELGEKYPDEYDTRGKKAGLNALKAMAIAERCQSVRREGMKQAYRVIVDPEHKFRLQFKKTRMFCQTVVLKYHIDGVTYVRREGEPMVKVSKFV